MVKQAACCANQPNLNTFIDRDISNEYLNLCLDWSTSNPFDLRKTLAKSDPRLINLVFSMLTFNPEYRLTAAELIKDPIFD